MTTVLVTGPIGGGKSTVCRILELAGYPVYDCDARCKALYDTVPGLKEQIEKELEIPFRELGRIFCNDARDVIRYKDKLICRNCLEQLKKEI